jgi:hypothetical protein
VKVAPYHTSSDEDVAVYHIYDDCPAGERVIADGNSVPGYRGRLCDLCATKDAGGHF